MHRDLLLMDTDIVSAMGRQRPPPGMRPWLIDIGMERLAISFPSIAELRRGAHLLEATYPEKAAAISKWVDEVLQTGFVMLEMTPEVASVYAEMTSTPCLRWMWTVPHNAKHNRLGHDLMVASVAIAHGAPILTGNARDYLRVHELFPLPGVYDPLRREWHVEPSRAVDLPPWQSADRLFEVPLPRIKKNDDAIVRHRRGWNPAWSPSPMAKSRFRTSAHGGMA